MQKHLLFELLLNDPPFKNNMRDGSGLVPVTQAWGLEFRSLETHMKAGWATYNLSL